jgi:dTDP-glucose pyrophosphorylase/CBS domain-containing protein
MRPTTDERIRAMLVPPDASIRDTMRCIDEAGFEIALMVAGDGRLIGTISDGDVRRALLGGAEMDDPVGPFVSRRPITIGPGAGRAAAIDIMRARTISQVPEVDEEGRLTGLHLLHEVIGVPERPNWALIVAGGKGTRLGELTRATPKPMLEVAGRPILERIVLHLVGSGIHRIALSVGYLGEPIEEHFGDGSEFGCLIEYVWESPDRPLGTGGPLGLLGAWQEPPAHPVLCMNGDLVTSFSVSGILGGHATAGAAMTMGLREYVHDVPFGVVRLNDGRVESIEEKPRWSWTVNAGIYVVEPRLLDRIPTDRLFPITDLAQDCLERGEHVHGWLVEGEWHDVGRPSELRAARGQA